WIALVLCAHGCAPSAVGSPAPAPDGPRLEVRIDERFYQVEGLTPQDLNLALRENGPRLREGERRWFGVTDFALRYRYQPRPWGNGCRAVEANVAVELVTTLPEWPDREAASPMLRDHWDLFISRLREHERGHQRIAMLAGRDLLRGVEALRAPDCE